MHSLNGFDSYIDLHKVGFKLAPIFVGELFLLKKLNHPIYLFRGDVFCPIIEAGPPPTRELITFLLKNEIREVYLYREDHLEIKNNLESALLKITRALSIGNPMENGSKELKLMSMNLESLYKNPHNDDKLILQFQSLQTLGKFLLENKKHHGFLYRFLMGENFHFTLSQPMLSSLLLLSFLQSIHLFHEKEIENLFSASYFKDIGFSLIPSEKYDLKELSNRDKELFASHADYSFDLLEGRIPISKSYLAIIKNHHFLNDKIKKIMSPYQVNSDSEMIYGIESTLVSIFDVFVAMTSNRPYRKGITHYKALEVIKKIMSDDYPQEFKALVIFLKQFFKN